MKEKKENSYAIDPLHEVAGVVFMSLLFCGMIYLSVRSHEQKKMLEDRGVPTFSERLEKNYSLSKEVIRCMDEKNKFVFSKKEYPNFDFYASKLFVLCLKHDPDLRSKFFEQQKK